MDAYLLEACREIIQGLTDKDALSFRGVFVACAEEAARTGDKKLEGLMRLLGGVFSMYFRFDPKRPYGRLAEFPDGSRTMLPQDITEEELIQLEQVVQASDQPVFVARIWDILWIRRRNPIGFTGVVP